MNIKINLLIACLLISFTSLFAQVGINTPTPQSSFEVRADTLNLSLPDGIIPPKLTGDQLFKKDTTYGPNQAGAMIYLTAAPTSTATQLSGITVASDSGYYYFDGKKWQQLAIQPSDSASAWFSTSTNLASMSVNDTVYHLNPVGIGTATPDSMLTVVGGATIANDMIVDSLTVGLGGGQDSSNTVLGYRAFEQNSSGTYNTAVAWQALFANTVGSYNTALGISALSTGNGSSSYNTAVGHWASKDNVSGTYNTALGTRAMYNSTTASNTTAIGPSALVRLTTGEENTAIGTSALNYVLLGSRNIGVGYNNSPGTDGNDNILIGSYAAARYNAGGPDFNILIGSYSSNNQADENKNTTIGYRSLAANSLGENNVALGYQAGIGNAGSNNILIGSGAGNNSYQPYDTIISIQEILGDGNIFIGSQVGTGMSVPGGNVIIGSLDSSNSVLDPNAANSIYLGTGGTADSIADGILRMEINSAGATQFYGTLSALSSMVATASADPQMADGITAPILSGDELFAKDSAYTIAQKGSMIYLSAAPTSMSTEASGITVASNAGYYYYDGTQWQQFAIQASDSASAWFSTSTNLASMNVNEAVYHLNSVGIGTATPDSMLTVNGGATIANDIVVNKINIGLGRGQDSTNTVVGNNALTNNVSGSENTGVGHSVLTSNTTGGQNTAVGYAVLANNTLGKSNAGVGNNALVKNEIGDHNTAVGNNALWNNIDGSENSAYGHGALQSNRTGAFNSGFGIAALMSNMSGKYNTSMGYNAGNGNATNNYNTSMGVSALQRTVGTGNSAFGVQALSFNTGSPISYGSYNSALGYFAGKSNSGSSNIFIGNLAGDSSSSDFVGDKNIFIGTKAGRGLSTGGGNVVIGAIDAASLGVDVLGAQNAIYLGTGGQDSASLADGILRMMIDSAGATQFYGSVTTISAFYSNSDRRLKTNIQDITLPDNLVDLMKPVVYDKKSSMSATNYSSHEYGFIAQDIQKIFPSMVKKANDKDGTLSISYTQLIPVLTKLLQDRKEVINQQQVNIDQLKKEIEEIKALL